MTVGMNDAATAAAKRRGLPKWSVIGILWLWLALLLVTHAGARSPYSYGWALFDRDGARLFGSVVNPDALTVYPVTLFFYEPVAIDYTSAHNLKLPLHSFATSVTASFVRSYPLANYVTNLAFLWLLAVVIVNFGERMGIGRAPLLLTSLTLFSLPYYTHYAGQPMQYIAGPVVSFLVMMAAIACSRLGWRQPWLYGALFAILTLNYDWYVFGAALAAYTLFVVRFPRSRDYAVWAVVAFLPALLWSTFLRAISHDTISKLVRDAFLPAIVSAWAEIIRHADLVLAYAATHVGLNIALNEIITMLGWPILALVLFGLIRLRPEVLRDRTNVLPLLLVAAYIGEQLVTAAFDWENNPRRAIPVIAACFYAYAYVADRTWNSRRWRLALAAVLVATLGLSFADTVFRSPVITYLSTGQAIRSAPKLVFSMAGRTLTPDSLPHLMADRYDGFWLWGAAAIRNPELLPAWVVAQLFAGGALLALLAILARAELLPRRAPLVALGLVAASLVIRFV
ncbi:MAG: hypothetical protein JWO56_3765 [Acidobacteria bacterium]|nr:hypothetical protein [Acidobacteriota bacterium]